jgi:hypothetical protein
MDNSDSNKEAPLASAAQDYGTSSDHLAWWKNLLVLSAPLVGLMFVRKKAERILTNQHNDPTLSPYIVMFHLALPTHSMGISFSIG